MKEMKRVLVLAKYVGQGAALILEVINALNTLTTTAGRGRR